MPELPEVETLANKLRARLCGSSIKDATVLWPRSIALPSAAEFAASIRTHIIKAIGRRGKYLVFSLVRRDTAVPKFLLIHLRMSGVLSIVRHSRKLAKHDRVILSLNDGRDLRFHDTRKFGRMYLVEDPERVTLGLGIDALDPSLTAERFHALLSARGGAIKPLLLGQGLIAGLGNIYVDESLWRAGIHPLRKSSTIPKLKTKNLLVAIHTTLRSAIGAEGTDFGDGVVEFGRYRTRVYDRAGAACLRCRTRIRRIVVGQRGTYFCPRCQKS